MKIRSLLSATFLSWVAFDANLFRRRRSAQASSATEISLDQAHEDLEEKKQQKQNRRSVIPPHLRDIGPAPVRKRCSYYSTKSRDVRDSDQKKIRRRFNNM